MQLILFLSSTRIGGFYLFIFSSVIVFSQNIQNINTSILSAQSIVFMGQQIETPQLLGLLEWKYIILKVNL